MKRHLLILILGISFILSCKPRKLSEYYTKDIAKEKKYPYYPEWEDDSLFIHLSLKDSSFIMVLPYNLGHTISGRYLRKGRVVTFYPDIFILKKKYFSNIPNDSVRLKFTFKDTINNYYFVMDSFIFDIDGNMIRTNSNGIINYSLKKGESKTVKIKNIILNRFYLTINIDNKKFNFYEIIITKRIPNINPDFFKMILRRDGTLKNKTGDIWNPVSYSLQQTKE